MSTDTAVRTSKDEKPDVEFEVATQDKPIDDDTDVSLLACIQFHMMSEHNVPDALHLDDDEAEDLHAKLHDVMPAGAHAADDRRFRPGRAISFLMAHVQREHAATLTTPRPPRPRPAAKKTATKKAAVKPDTSKKG